MPIVFLSLALHVSPTQALAAIDAPPVTTATLNNLAASVSHAAAMATSTWRILSRVTPGRGSASSACTTQTAPPAPTANRVTTATPWPMTADVSEEDKKHIGLFITLAPLYGQRMSLGITLFLCEKKNLETLFAKSLA